MDVVDGGLRVLTDTTMVNLTFPDGAIARPLGRGPLGAPWAAALVDFVAYVAYEGGGVEARRAGLVGQRP